MNRLLRRSPTAWRFQHRRGDEVMWMSGIGEVDAGIRSRKFRDLLRIQKAELWLPNVVTDEGEDWVLYAAFQDVPEAAGGGTFTNFELVLPTNASGLAETSTFSTLTFNTANGNTAKTINRNGTDWATPTGTTPSSMALAATQTWTASGGTLGGGTLNYCALTTAGLTTEVLIAYVGLSTARTVADGESLDVDFDMQAGGS